MAVVSERWVFVIMLVISLQSRFIVISEKLICNSGDLRGLRGFVNELDSPINEWWPTNSSSFLSSNCCNWVGITCNSSSGRIVKLELPKKGLIGSFSELFSNLDQLQTLNLSQNFLRGPLSISLFHLLRLEALDLSSNKFNGVLPVNINLPALRIVDLSDNAFTGFFPSLLCLNSTEIRVLKFAANHFNGTISSQFRNCNFLEHMDVASNSISGIIPDFLFRLPKLLELALQDNKFTTIDGYGKFSSHLVRLDLSSNRLSGNIPDFFHMFPNLSYFSLHSNNLIGEIPPSLSNSHSISSLNLRNNSLNGSIDFNCSVMINLTSLDLSSNNFSGTIPANLASCVKLKAIILSRNKLKGEIPESFKNFNSLSYLALANCHLTNLSNSLKVLQHSPHLTVLVLAMNFYDEPLPLDDDLHFKALKALVITECRLTGSFPSWLNGLAQLQVLDLSLNKLKGSIPGYLGDLKSLFYLNLSYNSFSGEIPKNLTRLESLISRFILLEESSPDFPFFTYRESGKSSWRIRIMRFPPILDLSSNLLTGPTWPEFGNLKKLHGLDLKHNNLSGLIPSSLSGMRSIEMLDLSFNRLTGTIPTSLGKLSFLSKFSVAHNNLMGMIPFGGQLSTFANSSFEGNSGLCRRFFGSCHKIDQVPLKTPTSENEDGLEDSLMILFVLTGFGTGFLVTVIILLVIPTL